MSQAILSSSPDSDSPVRIPADDSDRRCHIVKVVRHVPLPQLEALRETNSDDATLEEEPNQPIVRDEGGTENNQDAIKSIDPPLLKSTSST